MGVIAVSVRDADFEVAVGRHFFVGYLDNGGNSAELNPQESSRSGYLRLGRLCRSRKVALVKNAPGGPE